MEYKRLDQAKTPASSLSKQKQQQFIELRSKLRGLPGDDPVRLTTELANLFKQAKKFKDNS